MVARYAFVFWYGRSTCRISAYCVWRTSSRHGMHFSSVCDKLRHAIYCRGILFSNSCSACRTCFCVVEYIASSTAGPAGPAPVVYYITPASMEFVEVALHEIDEEQCRDDFEELCCVARMSRKRIWRRVWHSRSTPSDASKSERSWRKLSKRLCYEEGFDEMKLTCACCGRFEDEDDILVRCQGPDCSLRSATWSVPRTLRGCFGPPRRCTVAELSKVAANNISCRACYGDW